LARSAPAEEEARHDSRNAWLRLADSVKALVLATFGACALGADAYAPVSPVKAYYDFIYYVSVGDIDTALAQFADDAFVIAGPLCSRERLVGAKLQSENALWNR
jgi:hypothetical protein